MVRGANWQHPKRKHFRSPRRRMIVRLASSSTPRSGEVTTAALSKDSFPARRTAGSGPSDAYSSPRRIMPRDPTDGYRLVELHLCDGAPIAAPVGGVSREPLTQDLFGPRVATTPS